MPISPKWLWCMLEHDLPKISIEFFGKDHRYCGIDALPHLNLRHDQRRLAGAIDADEGIGRKLSCGAVGRLLRLIDGACRKIEGEHEHAGESSLQHRAPRREKSGMFCDMHRRPPRFDRHPGRV